VNSKLKIAVLAGGIGAEREISLDIDVFFLALHGKFGEDGGLQQILEERGLVYTSSGVEASRLAFDKMASKEIFCQAGVKTAGGVKFESDTDISDLKNKLDCSTGKYVVKPITQGSSVGVVIVGVDVVSQAAKKCLAEFGDCMIEEFIEGPEITCGILCDRALPLLEVKAQTGFYDYYAKYEDEQTEYLFDTIADEELVKKVQEAALKCFNALGCRDFARVDFILDQNQEAYALELNTIPGLTSHSLLPKAAARTGLSMGELCIKIIDAAVKNNVAHSR